MTDLCLKNWAAMDVPDARDLSVTAETVLTDLDDSDTEPSAFFSFIASSSILLDKCITRILLLEKVRLTLRLRNLPESFDHHLS